MSAIHHFLDHPTHTQLPIVICNNSQSSLVALRKGFMAQKTPLVASVRVALAHGLLSLLWTLRQRVIIAAHVKVSDDCAHA